MGSVRIEKTMVLKAIACYEDNESVIVGGTYEIRVDTPAASVPSGTYDHVLSVALSCASENTTIRYTTNGSLPSRSEGFIYSTPISIDRSVWLKAIAYNEIIESEISANQYRIQVLDPVISQASGIYDTPVTVTLGCPTAAAVIRYTLDGSVPTGDTGYPYTNSFVVNKTASLTVKAFHPGLPSSDPVTAQYNIKVKTPSISKASGTYDYHFAVNISCPTTEAEIYYTLDGSTPSRSTGLLYTGPVIVDHALTLRAIAVRDDLPDSNLVSAQYAFQVKTPVISKASGMYENEFTVSIVCPTEGVKIYYTLDGNQPSISGGILYTGPFVVGRPLTLSVIAVKDGLSDSFVAMKTYGFVVAEPVVNTAAGMYYNAITVAAACDTAGARLYYTLDGTSPLYHGRLYVGPITIDRSVQLRIVAVKTDWQDSPVSSVLYRMKVDKPLIRYRQESGYTVVEISTRTVGSSIQYHFPSDYYWRNYSYAFSITKSENMVAIAKRDGFEDSDAVSWYIEVLP